MRAGTQYLTRVSYILPLDSPPHCGYIGGVQQRTRKADMSTPAEKPRCFRAVYDGTCVLTGKRFKKGAEVYRCGNGYAKFVAPAPKGWYYPEGEHELARATENVS